MLTWARAQKTRALPSAEAELYSIGSGAIEKIGSSTMFARMTVHSSTASTNRITERTCGVQAKRAKSNETHRAEDAHSAGMAENGTTTQSQSVDSRQSGRTS